MEPTDSDASFEPQQRARSNTWPLPRPENYVDKDESEAGPPDPSKQDASGLPKKNSSRRNAWGNMSYADLITQAIQSSPEKRLTLSQIYDWMVQNVAYFKDKGDSNSSAGWKNSIRHNLSLHNRFMRVQNEGTGKSSWWMINPDAKPGKAARRRATSMETQKYEKRRGRVKKKVEALRNGLDVTGSPSSSISESLDIFPESPLQHPTFQLSPDFRPRASSNASSCGRLSPIPAVENDMHDGDVSPMSPLPWNSEMSSSGTLVGLYTSAGTDRYGTDQLVDTLAETMKIGTTASGSDPGSYLSECTMKASPTNQMSPHMAMPPQQSQQQQPPPQQPQTTNGYSMPPPPYSASSQYGDYHSSYPSPADTRKLSPLPASPQRILHDNMSVTSSYNLTNLQALSPAPSAHSLSPPHSMDTMVPPPTHFGPDRRTPAPPAAAPSTTAGERLLSHLTSQSSAYNPSVNPTSGYCALNLQAATPGATSIPAADSTMLRAVLTQKDNGAITTTTPTASQMMGHLMALNNGIPNDLDLSMDALQGELECDVDQVIRHELSVDGNLDFNFADPQNVSSLPTTVAATGGHHWVH